MPAVLGWSDGLGDGSTPYTLEAVYRQERATTDAGKAVFELNYTGEDVGKTYYYKLSEIAGTAAHVTYDDSVYEFTVTVSADADGKLVTEIDGAAGNTYRASFTNVYDYTPTEPGPVTPVEPDVPDSASVPLIVTKSVVETGEVKLGLEGWEFVLDSVESGKKIVRTTDKSGQANFFLYFSEYDLGKTFNYILTETAPEGAVNRIAGNVLYDGTVHQIQVEVVRSRYGALETKVTIDGQLSEEYFQKLSFTNVELSGVEDVTLKVKAHKTMKNTGDEKLGPEEFKIILKRVDADGEKIGKTMSDRTSKKGNVTFQLPAYTIEDVGQTFRYQIYEKDEGKQNVTYDETVHEFAVQVSLTEDLKLQASLMLPLSVAEKYAKDTDNEKLLEAVREMKDSEVQWIDMTDYGWKAEFTNTFHCVKEDVPKTGDDSDVDFWFTMMILSLISTIALFIAERRYSRKAYKAKR